MSLPTDAVTSAAAFEQRYRANVDPWNFATSAYEQSRYQVLLDTLLRPRYSSIFEPGCSVGELTALLGEIGDEVIATDFAPSAISRARQRCAGLPHVQLSVADLRAAPCPPQTDLVVFSEVGYYFSRADLANIVCSLAQTLPPGAEFVASHWLGTSPDHVLHGDRVHRLLLDVLPLRWVKGARYSHFRIDTWMKFV